MGALGAAGASVASHLSGAGYGNLSWADRTGEGLPDGVAVARLGVTLEEFAEVQREQFGFDLRTSLAMWDVYVALCERYPGESQEGIDRMWLVVMAQGEYAGPAWQLVAGGVAEERRAYAGWMGDCVLVGNERTGAAALGPDDYKSDLDADSICRRAQGQGVPYQQAARDYYRELAEGAANRADVFLANHGGHDCVVGEVYHNLTRPDDIAAAKGQVVLAGDGVVEHGIDGRGGVTFHYVEHTTEEMLEIIGGDPRLADTARFLEALGRGESDLPLGER